MPSPIPTRVAQYLRMSREHQNYSLENQAAHNAVFAAEHGFEVVETYTDSGVSGLCLKGRGALRRLLFDILGGQAGFAAVLVYDVSRWGRFQDPDQAAHYEFLCRQAGVQILYTAELFPADTSLVAALLKQMKRGMAAEFSRELSERIRRAKWRLAEKGYWQSAQPGYGLRRLSVTATGEPRLVMQDGERKGVQNHRTILVPGPPAEVETVRRIFRLYVAGGMSRREIARVLNNEGVVAAGGARWTDARVKGVLENEKYIGTNVLGRSRYDLGRRRSQPSSTWLRIPGAFEAVVSPEMFRLAAQNARRRGPHAADRVLIAELRQALRIHGHLSADILRREPKTHCASVYRRRFGSLAAAYRLAGYEPGRQQLAAAAASARRVRPARFGHPPTVWEDGDLLAALRALQAREGRISVALINADPALPSAGVCIKRFGGMPAIYELVGHIPTPQQQSAARFARSGPEALGLYPVADWAG